MLDVSNQPRAAIVDAETRYFWMIVERYASAMQDGRADDAFDLRSDFEAVVLHSDQPQIRAASLLIPEI